MRRTSICLLLAGLAACDDADSTSEGPDAAVDAAAVTWHRDIAPLVAGYCARCHTEGGTAPFVFDDYAAARAQAPLMAQAVAARTMPPFLAAPAVRPLAYDASLSEAQIALFQRWAELGAPEGDPATAAPPIEVPLGRLSRVDHTLQMPVTYAPPAGDDDYRCFVIPWAEPTTYITGVNVQPGNPRIAHHAVVYLIDPPYAAAVDTAEGQDGRPGYPCFGGASPPTVDFMPAKIVAAWVPGEAGHDFPAGTGVRVEAGSRVVLQMHYSTLGAGAQTDRSSVELSLAESVEKNAGNLPWVNPEWPGRPETMRIPAGAEGVEYSYSARPSESSLLEAFLPGVDPSQGFDLYAVLPHLHKLGRRIELDIERADGAVEPLVHIGRWDFDWQAYYTFATPVRVGPEDRIRLRCVWDNTAANQPVVGGEPRTPQDVLWGENTHDEMCAAAFYATGVAQGSPACATVGSVAAEEGRFAVTFDATEAVRTSPRLDGPLRGLASVAIYRSADVALTGPLDGTEPVAGGSFEIDLTAGPDGPYGFEVLPAGEYQILGFLDVDGNAGEDGPDQNDPLLIPGPRHALECADQPISARFSLLLP